MSPHARAIMIFGALLTSWFFQLVESTHPVLIKRVYDPMNISGPPATPGPDPAQLVWTNIHCTNEFGSYSNDPRQSSCTDSSLIKYSCATSQCHMGTAYDTPKTRPLNERLFFRGCQRVGVKEKTTYLVYAISYVLRDEKGFLTAVGFAVGDMTETTYHFKCPWKEDAHLNTRRVWCDSCLQAQDSQKKKPAKRA